MTLFSKTNPIDLATFVIATKKHEISRIGHLIEGKMFSWTEKNMPDSREGG